MTSLYRLLTAILLLAGVALPARGDEPAINSTRKGTTVFGFYVGTTLSDFGGESTPQWVSRFGSVVGTYGVFYLTDLLALQTDLSLDSKGGRIEERYDSDGVQINPAADIRLGYVEFAVLARMNQPISRYRDECNFRPKLLLGFAIGTKVSTSGRGIADYLQPHFRDADLILIFGGGFDQLVWGKRSLTIDLRFGFGMRDVFADWVNSDADARFLVGFSL
jgi:hypothetical protein